MCLRPLLRRKIPGRPSAAHSAALRAHSHKVHPVVTLRGGKRAPDALWRARDGWVVFFRAERAYCEDHALATTSVALGDNPSDYPARVKHASAQRTAHSAPAGFAAGLPQPRHAPALLAQYNAAARAFSRAR